MLIKITQNVDDEEVKIIKYNKLLPESWDIEHLNANDKYLKYNEYVMPYSTDFINYINKRFNKYILTETTKVNKGEAFPYQLLIRDYLSYGTPYRGLLLAHGLGSGKTRTCILVSESFRRNGLQILFLGPATLKNSFINELYQWGDKDIQLTTDSNNSLEKLKKREIIDKHYKFISSNSSNLLVQLARIGIGFPDKFENMKNKSVADFLNKNPNIKLDYPKNMLIILEEAHNINQKFSSKSSKIIKTVYTILKNAKDCKILALSATPVINNPFEICSLLNVIKGPLIDGSTILPENEDEFNMLYVNNKNKIINKAELQMRILGLISYYKGIESDKTLYPDLIYKEMNEVLMSKEQNTIHDYFLELDLKKFLNKDLSSEDNLTDLIKEMEIKEKKYGLPTNSYRIKSRTACNYVWKIKPTDIDKPEMAILLHILEFKNIDFKNPHDIAKLFFEKPPEDIDEIKTQINNFPFSEEKRFNYYDFIMSFDSSIKLIKDILTCAVLLTYCNISRLPEVLNLQDKSLLKKKNRFNLQHVAPYLTDLDIIKINEMIKSRKQKIDEAIAKMVEDADNYFSDEALLLHSPKMLVLFKNIINGDGCLKLTDKTIEPIELIDTDVFYQVDTDELAEVGEEGLVIEDSPIDLDMDDVTIKKAEFKIDKQFLILQNDNPLFPQGDLNLNTPEEYFAYFKEKNNINVEYLLQTANRYIIYTPSLNVFKNKLYIKENHYGIGLMYYRNYLNSIEPYTQLPQIVGHELFNFKDIYMTDKVEGGPAFVYSEFNNAEGIAMFSKVLEYNGFNLFDPNDYDEDNIDDLNIDDFAPRYCVISGNINMLDRSKILRFFNHPINKHGQFINIILGTSAASEGINLRFVRQVHILEPFWHNVKIQQVIGRARRVHSHSLLPLDERNVYIYKYVSKSATGIESTDEYLYYLAEKKSKMIEDLYNVIRGSSIDCMLNSAINGPTINCFKFPRNKVNEPAFKLDKIENKEKENVIKIEEDVKLLGVKNANGQIIGYYKVIKEFTSDIPAERKIYKLVTNPKLGVYSGQKLMLFPIYNEKAINGDLNIISYGYILPNLKLIRFPVNSIASLLY